ncbi:MAG TPA: ABC transporter substrate-binding protein [Opitutales bacterium]|nr:ABC transporter substrate-binding protein [Opitutales bacterium]
MSKSPIAALIAIAAAAILLSGCSERRKDAEEGLAQVRLQTDWYPQGEHGGFYYALACGYYREEGLDVEILPGGLSYMGALKVTEGRAEFAMHKAEAIVRHTDQGMPLRIVMATLQHDPQGILVHDESPVRSFADLNGRLLMAMPGGTWLAFLSRKYGIEPVIVPSDKGMERFLADPGLSQQCMATSEPFYAAQKGVRTRVLLLRDAGFDPYHVVYTSNSFAAAHPEEVTAFVRASIRGWRDYLTKDPSPAFELIKRLNPRQTDAQLNFSRQALIDGGYAFDPAHPEECGTISDSRMEALSAQMIELGLIGRMPGPSLWKLAPKTPGHQP